MSKWTEWGVLTLNNNLEYPCYIRNKHAYVMYRKSKGEPGEGANACFLQQYIHLYDEQYKIINNN